MEDRFKFRAWHKPSKTMVDWLTLKQTAFNTGKFSIMYEFFTTWQYSDEYETMQCTGLKDKTRTTEYPKGKLIYDGDLVKAEGFSNPSIFKIVFVEGAYGAIHPKEDDGYVLDMNIFYPSIGCRIEIIGNIYENPDLI